MTEFTAKDLHLVKKALAIAAGSDPLDIIESDIELEHYARSARIAVTGEAG
jgi:biotin carboxylase